MCLCISTDLLLKFLFSQEGPNKISVFGQSTRTNAAVEAYNGYIGKTIQAHPNLFGLAKKLREEEFAKSREFDLMLKTANPPQQRRFYRLRDAKIKKMSGLLKRGEISVDVFLSGMVCDNNQIFDDSCRFYGDLGSNLYGSDSEEDLPSQADSQPRANGVITGGTCAICYHNPSDVLLSCGHYNNCLTCFNTMKKNYEDEMIAYHLGRLDDEPRFKCAVCNANITAHMHVPRIFS